MNYDTNAPGARNNSIDVHPPSGIVPHSSIVPKNSSNGNPQDRTTQARTNIAAQRAIQQILPSAPPLNNDEIFEENGLSLEELDALINQVIDDGKHLIDDGKLLDDSLTKVESRDENVSSFVDKNSENLTEIHHKYIEESELENILTHGNFHNMAMGDADGNIVKFGQISTKSLLDSILNKHVCIYEINEEDGTARRITNDLDAEKNLPQTIEFIGKDGKKKTLKITDTLYIRHEHVAKFHSMLATYHALQISNRNILQNNMPKNEASTKGKEQRTHSLGMHDQIKAEVNHHAIKHHLNNNMTFSPIFSILQQASIIKKREETHKKLEELKKAVEHEIINKEILKKVDTMWDQEQELLNLDVLKTAINKICEHVENGIMKPPVSVEMTTKEFITRMFIPIDKIINTPGTPLGIKEKLLSIKKDILLFAKIIVEAVGVNAVEGNKGASPIIKI